MLSDSHLTTDQVLAAFTEEITARQGQVKEAAHDGQCLFVRSILPPVEEVRPRDGLQGGVALKLTEGGVWLYPYLFRQVCQNGAIIAQSLESRELGDVFLREPQEALDSIREGIAACCEPEVFTETVDKVRTTCLTHVDLALSMMPIISRLMQLGNAELVTQVMDRFFRGNDQSQFGLANAITSLARDTRQPVLRWELEELGGEIATGSFVPTRQPVFA